MEAPRRKPGDNPRRLKTGPGAFELDAALIPLLAHGGFYVGMPALSCHAEAHATESRTVCGMSMETNHAAG